MQLHQIRGARASGRLTCHEDYRLAGLQRAVLHQENVHLVEHFIGRADIGRQDRGDAVINRQLPGRRFIRRDGVDGNRRAVARNQAGARAAGGENYDGRDSGFARGAVGRVRQDLRIARMGTPCGGS